MYASTSFSCSGVVNCLTNSSSGANTKAATPNIVSGRVENTSIFVFSSPETGKFIAAPTERPIQLRCCSLIASGQSKSSKSSIKRSA